MPYGMIALSVFWIATIKLWFTDGPKIPVIGIILWLILFFGVPWLHWPGLVLTVAEAILGLALLLIDRYKSALM